MASSQPSSAPSPPPGAEHNNRVSAKSTADPILRNALRYTISAKEYESLHKYIISRSKLLKRNAPSVAQIERLVDGGSGRAGGSVGGWNGEYNVAAVRASLRVFLVTAAGLRAWDVISKRLLGAKDVKGKRVPLWKSPNFRLSLSLSTILLLHRILFRFFTRLRAHLLTDEARPFRQRNKRTSKTLTSSLAPAIGASLAGFALAVYPKDQLRVTIAIYALSSAAEYAYNLAEDEGWIWGKEGSKWERPWWWGSWLLLPLSTGQLLHAFIFDRDVYPKAFGNFVLGNSAEYIRDRPLDYPSNLPWPSADEVVDSLGQAARLKYPKFVSPILFPNRETLPKSLSAIAPLTASAHPMIQSLTCATIHPNDPSCLRTYLTYWIRAFPKIARFFTAFFIAFSLPAYKAFYNAPMTMLNMLAGRVLRYSIFVSGAIGTSWASICLFQSLLPAVVLPTQRFFFSGFLGGLWAFVVKGIARDDIMNTVRLSIDSLWKVGRKKGWWRGGRGGDVWLFVVGMMAINAVFEHNPKSIRGGLVRKSLSSLRGEGLRDPVAEAEEAEKKGKEAEEAAAKEKTTEGQ